MIYPNTTFAGQKVTICNRYVEHFRQEADNHAAGVNARALIAEFNDLIPEAYHQYPLIWLDIKWQDVLDGKLNPDYPLKSDDKYIIIPISEEDREALTTKKDEALLTLKEFYKYQREVFTPTIKNLLHERHKAEQECRQDTTHNPTLADFKRVNGKLSLDVPSKNPMNEATNIAFAMRALELFPDIDSEQTAAISEALGNAKEKTKKSDFWDNRLDKELVRVNINLPEPPDPIEDFTTYTNFTDALPDPLVVTSTTIAGTAVSRNEDTYVYDDKGVGYFSGDFTHQADTMVSNVSGNSVVVAWALTNDIDDFNNLFLANKNFLCLQFNNGTLYFLREFLAGSVTTDISIALTDGQTYYNTIDRDEGIGSFGQLTDAIFSDINRTLSVDVLSILLNAKLDLRYVFGMGSWNDSNGSTCDISVSNLDLQEAIAAFNPAWARNSNQIMGVSQ